MLVAHPEGVGGSTSLQETSQCPVGMLWALMMDVLSWVSLKQTGGRVGSEKVSNDHVQKEEWENNSSFLKENWGGSWKVVKSFKNCQAKQISFTTFFSWWKCFSDRNLLMKQSFITMGPFICWLLIFSISEPWEYPGIPCCCINSVVGLPLLSTTLKSTWGVKQPKWMWWGRTWGWSSLAACKGSK